MAGKAPLLLASVLFAVGAVGLALTQAERAEWGPFEPQRQAPATRQVIVYHANPPFVDPMLLEGLLRPPDVDDGRSSQAFVAAPEPTPEPEPAATPNPPLRIFGISSDDGGVSAAGATPSPPPIRIVNVSGGAGEEPTPEATPEPEPTAEPEATPEAADGEPEPTETPEAE